MHIVFYFTGNETVVDLYLHEDNASVKSEPEIPCDSKDTVLKLVNDGNPFIKTEPLEGQIKREGYVDSRVIENNILMDVKEEPLTTSSDFEHNYCHDDREAIEAEEDVKVAVPDTPLLDHSYSLPYKDLQDSTQHSHAKEEKLDDSVQQENNLIFGLDDSYRDERRKADADFSTNKVSFWTISSFHK